MGKRFYFLDSAPFDERTNEQYGQYISGHTHIMFLDKKENKSEAFFLLLLPIYRGGGGGTKYIFDRKKILMKHLSCAAYFSRVMNAHIVFSPFCR